MASVTEVARKAKQPYGGFIKPSQFTKIALTKEEELSAKENLSPATIGMVVDYMSRYMMSGDIRKAFEISYKGAWLAKLSGYEEAMDVAESLLKGIRGLDDESISCACKLVWFDAYYRVPMWAKEHQQDKKDNADLQTIANIRIMVKRSIAFWKEYGPIVVDGFTFGPASVTNEQDNDVVRYGAYGGYTRTVDGGDGDYLSEDTLWDFKVSKKDLTSKITLQLLMYWIMGIHSGKQEFQTIKMIGVFNPRLNTVYRMNVADIPKDVVKTVEDDVIRYGKPVVRQPSVSSLCKKDRLKESNEKEYKKGNIVEHKVFGRGKVLKVKPAAGDQIVEINFEKVGVKKTMANFAPLTKITEE